MRLHNRRVKRKHVHAHAYIHAYTNTHAGHAEVSASLAFVATIGGGRGPLSLAIFHSKIVSEAKFHFVNFIAILWIWYFTRRFDVCCTCNFQAKLLFNRRHFLVWISFYSIYTAILIEWKCWKRFEGLQISKLIKISLLGRINIFLKGKENAKTTLNLDNYFYSCFPLWNANEFNHRFLTIYKFIIVIIIDISKRIREI